MILVILYVSLKTKLIMLSEERRREIGQTIFDLFVLKHFVKREEALANEKINLRYASNMAKFLGCDSHDLISAITSSFWRLQGMIVVSEKIDQKKEDKIFWLASKANIMGNKEPLRDYKRGFGNLATRLNLQNRTLGLSTAELLQYAHPIYLEVIEEMFPEQSR